MKAVKNLFVVIGLVGVCYGLFVVLNTKQDNPLEDQANQQYWNNEPDISLGVPGVGTDGIPGVTPGSESSLQPFDPFDAAVTTPETTGQTVGGAPAFTGASSPEVGTPPDVWTSDPAAAPSATGLPPVDPGLSQGPAPEEKRKFTEPFYPQGPFGRDWEDSIAHYNGGRYAQALDILSQWHPLVSSRPPGRLTPDEMDHLVAMLDHLAFKVFYSGESFREQPYVTVPGDTLESIVAQGNYKVPWQLIGRINGIKGKNNSIKGKHIAPGTELKMLRGPFHAIVSVERNEMTLVYDGRYAARFPVRVGYNFSPTTIAHEVKAKMAPGDSHNGYQRYWLDLGGDLSICCLPSERGSGPAPGKTIFLTQDDMEDVFTILSCHSEIHIVR